MVLEILLSFAAGILLGLSIAAPPGPVNALIATHVVTKTKWWAGSFVGSGAMTADAIFLVITYSIGTAVHPTAGVLMAIYALGACVMFLFAYKASKAWRKPPIEEAQETRLTHSYLTGLAVALTNPYQILWWLTAGLAFIQGVGVAIVAGFFTGIIIWNLSFPFALDYARRRIEKAYKAILLFALATLTILGVWLVAQVVIMAIG